MNRDCTMITRRELLSRTGAAGLAGTLATLQPRLGLCDLEPQVAVVNDVHSQLNATPVREIVSPRSVAQLQNIVRSARSRRCAVSVCGGRHAMGGQQFGRDTVLLDMTGLNRVVEFDRALGEVEVEAGIQWPELIEFLLRAQQGAPDAWSIVQKQTGADRLCLGGILACNGHGRGLTLKPIIQDVESFTLVDANGDVRRCSRQENAELFRLAIGGYGLFGVVATIRLRLARRRVMQRVVEVRNVDDLISGFQLRIDDGFEYGDFQFATDEASPDFLRKGVFACYRPVENATTIPDNQRKLSAEDWRRLIHLAHVDKSRAFSMYAAHYLSTQGQLYWSDLQQLSLYVDDYHQKLDRELRAPAKCSEMISEVYVPRADLATFLADVREDFRVRRVELIYGTIRLIERDDESFLAWARQPYACVIFNLHMVHTPEGIEKVAGDFRRLIDAAIRYNGSYYLTYHRWATARQVLACYPQFPEFLRHKRRYDPDEVFQSDWYRHYRAMFADVA